MNEAQKNVDEKIKPSSIEYLIFEGGGGKGNAYLGVIQALEEVSGPYYASGNGNFSSNVITYQTSGDVYVNKGTGPKQ